MCLESKSSKLEVAENDFKCYKYVEFDCVEKEFRTPYRNVSIAKNVINGKKPFCAKGKLTTHKRREGFTCFEGGVIHTFKSLKDAKNQCDFWRDGVVFKCIIPKGTKYVSGNFELAYDNSECYASKKVIFQDIVYKRKKLSKDIKKVLGLI